MTPQRDESHYSYAVYADPAMARTFEDQRFGGPIGDLVASTQARVLTEMIGRIQDRSIVDVGTGAGRAAIVLARAGARVTAVDASAQMLEVARSRAAQDGVSIDFRRGDVHALEFEDRAFDVAVCLRVLMHAPDWPKAMAELCRVADRLVVFDYPSAASTAALHSAARRAIQAVGGRTEAYRVFTDAAIRRELARSGFSVRSMHRQFVLPIQFHKLIGSRRFTVATETLMERAGLLRHFGSPVTVCAERCASS